MTLSVEFSIISVEKVLVSSISVENVLFGYLLNLFRKIALKIKILYVFYTYDRHNNIVSNISIE